MSSTRVLSILLVVGLTSYAAPGAWATIYLALDADFEGKPVNQPIGTGGAAVGEPVEIVQSTDAIVRDTPMPSRCLEMSDIDEYFAGGAAFEFLDSAEYTTGLVKIEMDLWFEELEDYFVYVREQGTAAQTFANIRFSGGGIVVAEDADTTPGQVVGTYEADRVVPIVIQFDLDKGVWHLTLDGMRVLADEPHGVTERGVGQVIIGVSHDEDLDGKVNLDNLLVTWNDSPPACGAVPGIPKPADGGYILPLGLALCVIALGGVVMRWSAKPASRDAF